MTAIEYYKRLSALSDAYRITDKDGRTIFEDYYHDERIVGGENIFYYDINHGEINF
jgi:hypothetical protein